MPEIVECHSDCAYADRPLALTWQGERLGIERILSRWRSPAEQGFRVRCADGRTFALVYRELGDDWHIQPLQEAPCRNWPV